MSYLSKETILGAYKTLTELTNGGDTVLASQLRYLFALDFFQKSQNAVCNIKNDSDKNEFVKGVGLVVRLNSRSNAYAVDFNLGFRNSTDYKTSSNLFTQSVGLRSAESPEKVFTYPQSSNCPVFKAKNQTFYTDADSYKAASKLLKESPRFYAAFAVWVLRFTKFDNDIISEQDIINAWNNLVSEQMFTATKFQAEDIADATKLSAQNNLAEITESDIKAALAPTISFDSAFRQIIYYGAPGTGKSFKIDNDEKVDEDNCIRTTFHPDSDYSTFVGAYKPTMRDVRINSTYGESVQYATGKNGHPGTEEKIVYKYVPQAFLKAYVAAWKDLRHPYFLVIEEINRGNCAQIFGDLFQLLDRNNQGSSSYAIHSDEDIARFLSFDAAGFKVRGETEPPDRGISQEQADAISKFILVKDSGKEASIGPDILSGKKLLLPPNLYIWATMNTSDQSLFPIDSAFKRRWNWEYIPISYAPKDKKTGQPLNWAFEVGGKLYSWGKFLEAINPLILSLTDSTDKQMGYFFAKPDKKSDPAQERNNVISEKIFLNKVLFYIWTDALKDYDITREEFKKPDGKRLEFTDFFDADKDYIATFVAKLGLTEIGNAEEDNTANSEERTKRNYGRTLIVKFPDGTTIKGDTQFDSYLQAIQKIGIDAAANAIIKKGYTRNGAPLISKERQESIEKSATFSYVPCGEYFVIKGIDTMEGTLNGISKELNLDLEVYFE